MSLLDQLWDDTVAGPRPESGLGKLRKNSTFNARSSSVKESEARSSADGSETKVTRSIMILKPPQTQTGSPPLSPAGSTPPVSPFAEALLVNGVGQGEKPSGFAGSLHRMLSKRYVGLDPGALVLLMTCDI